MGGLFSSLPDKMAHTMAQNQQKMLEKQMENMMKQRELQMAMQIAMTKDRLRWMEGFGASLLLIALAAKKKMNTNLGFAPLYPFLFIYGYQWDLAYGNKLLRIKKYAEDELRYRPFRFFPPSNSLVISEDDYYKTFIKPRDYVDIESYFNASKKH